MVGWFIEGDSKLGGDTDGTWAIDVRHDHAVVVIIDGVMCDIDNVRPELTGKLLRLSNCPFAGEWLRNLELEYRLSQSN